MKKVAVLLVLAVVLSIFMMGGSTFSWFTGSAAPAGSIFTAEIPIQTKRIYDLDIGDRVMDSGWSWEFRTGEGYTGSGDVKPIVWIVVDKDHYGYQGFSGQGVLLLSEEIIGKGTYSFATNNWNTGGARTWLNSTFFAGLPANFRDAVLSTNLINANHLGSTYFTADRVFVLNVQELGGHPQIIPFGSTTSYFNGAPDERRRAMLGGSPVPYWTRSPKGSSPQNNVWYVTADGVIYKNFSTDAGTYAPARSNGYGYRPALNMDGNTLVNRIPNAEGIYLIHWP